MSLVAKSRIEELIISSYKPLLIFRCRVAQRFPDVFCCCCWFVVVVFVVFVLVVFVIVVVCGCVFLLMVVVFG